MIFKFAAKLRADRERKAIKAQAAERNAICRMYEDAAEAMNLGDLLVQSRFIIEDNREEVSAQDLHDYGNHMCRLADILARETA